MDFLLREYEADLATLAFSVPATEHSVMTARGREGEYKVLDLLLEQYPTGILSVVADSFDIYAFTDAVIARKDKILARDGRFVQRPDSTTPAHNTPADLTLAIIERLWDGFGGTVNSKGYKVLDDHIRALWGDGIDDPGVGQILHLLKSAGFSAENMVFGMGGGLLQKVNRDTQRSAFKCSAQLRDGTWHDIQKDPLDTSKKSKAGRLALVQEVDLATGQASFRTCSEAWSPGEAMDFLELVFENGKMMRLETLAEVRETARNDWGQRGSL
jgi:nicotinamide phosphoribosyltransferase